MGLAGFHATPEDQTQLTAAQGPFVLLNFLGSFGLLEDEAVSAVIVALEVRGGGFAAQVAIDALVIDIEFARDIVAVFVCCVCHG